MGFKMKTPSTHKGTKRHKEETKRYKELKVNRDLEHNMPDGRSMSSPFQKNDSPAKHPTHEDHHNDMSTVRTSPGWPAIPGSDRDKKEKVRAKKKSPAKATEVKLTPEEQKKKKVVEMSKEHEGKPGFKEYRDKVFGGKTTVEGSKSTTHKPVKEEEEK